MLNSLKLLKNLNLLFVEDDQKTSKEIIGSLEYLFKNVYHAKDGVDALDMYTKYHPDIILTDIKMPNMNGLELAEAIRENDYITPIIFLTAHSKNEMLLQAANLSIDGYVIKPINYDSVITLLTKVIKRNIFIQKKVQLNKNSFYDFSTKELFVNNTRVELGNKEQSLLKLFITNSDKTISKNDISQYLYPLDHVTDSAIKNLVSRLRTKIGRQSITYINGSGWKLLMQDGV